MEQTLCLLFQGRIMYYSLPAYMLLAMTSVSLDWCKETRFSYELCAEAALPGLRFRIKSCSAHGRVNLPKEP